MRHTEKCNPYAEKAAIRRHAWEAQQGGSFMTRKRFDAIDLILIVCGTVSLMIGIFGLISLI